jgi:hypothetical protein
MVFHLFLAKDISVMASSVATAIVLGAVVPQAETKMTLMMTTVATMNKTHHGAPSTPPSDPCLRVG